jgi:hypothetical protein
MITIIFIIAAVFWILLMTMQKYSGELFINPIIGLMIGALYCEEDGEHTFQILLCLVSLTFVWYNE